MSGARRHVLVALAALTGACAVAAVVATLLGSTGQERDVLLLALSAAGAASALLRGAWVRSERAAWLLTGIGTTCWTLAWTDFAVTGSPADPTTVGLADALWGLGYPAWFGAIWLVARARVGRVSLGTWLDGLVGALAAAALTSATVVETLLEEGLATTPLVFFFPLLDTLLIGMLATTLAGAGWRLTRSGSIWGLGFCLLVFTDGAHAMTVAQGQWTPGEFYELFWAMALVLLGGSAWADARRPAAPAASAPTARSPFRPVRPVAFAVLALATLVWSAVADLNAAAVCLSAAALAIVVARLVVTLAETARLAESRRLALTDEVTAGPNRRALLGGAAAAIEQGQPFALLMLDLDRFKELNDSLGHHAGDEALRQIAGRLRRLARPGDVVGRLGGDEFGVVLFGDAERAVSGAEAIRTALARPLDLDGLRIRVSASIGIALFPEHGTDVTALLRAADVAMYEAKRGKSSPRVYVPADDPHSRSRLELASELEGAIARGELTLRYQPIVSIEEDRVVSLEALVRWEHPVHGELSPASFLPAIEQSPLMRLLTDHVIRAALADAAGWPGDTGVSVNVSPEDVLDPGFTAFVDASIAEAGIAHSRVLLEITETAVLADPESAGRTLAELRALGVRVALDDFGTGYSSLTHLQQLPVDVVKVDRSFVQALAHDCAAAAIVRATSVVARAIGAQVVAEGVEDEQLSALARVNGCDLVQGFGLSRPVRNDAVAETCARLSRGRRAAAVPAPRTSPSAGSAAPRASARGCAPTTRPLART